MPPLITSIRTTLNLLLRSEQARDRRRHERLSVLQGVRILVDEKSAWFTGSVIDCSESGLGLLSSRRIEPGQRVIVDWKSGYFLGVCRNCRPSGDLWRIGIETESLNSHSPLLQELQETRWY